MNVLRTVFWLAAITAIVPFLAIPDRIMQITIAVLAFFIIVAAYVGKTLAQPQTFAPPQIGGDGNGDGQEYSKDKDTAASDTHGDGDTDKIEDNPVDVTDPDADRMMASGQWRRRASRDIGDSNA
jgi:hypothetical protein